MRAIVIFALVGVLFAGAAHAASDTIVYDDASENGYNGACSFGGVPSDFDFASTTTVHSGTNAIRFTPDAFNAVSWCTPATYSASTDFSGIRLWVNLNSSTAGQNIDLVLGLAGNVQASASLEALHGGPIAAGQWVQVQTQFSAAPMAFTGTFDQISLQAETNPTQPSVYFDDVTLLGANPPPDRIFSNDFEMTASAAGTIQIEHAATACTGSLTTERYTWADSLGRTRVATFSHNELGVNTNRKGMLCEYTYHTDAATVRDVLALDASGAGGFGYIVSHLANTASAAQIGQDDSPLGLAFSGATANLLNGRHHALLRFTLNYPRYYCTEDVNGNCTSATTTVQMPVTIDWLIATGRDHPLWAVSLDLSAAAANQIVADSRAPYGDMAFDGTAGGGFGDNINGVAWGDHYAFSTTSAPLSFNSSWDWSQPNTIPYVYLWTTPTDAEMGIVQSEDIAKQDAGGYFGQNSWGQTSAGGNACSTAFGDGNYRMPCDFNWPYQSVNYALDPANPNNGTNDKRLAWGTEFGFLGQGSYIGNDGASTITVPHQCESYSTYVTFGLHSAGVTAAQVTQVKNAMASTLSASVGTVTSSGFVGIGCRQDTRAYQPAGYNRIYGTWEVDAAGGNATVTLAAGGAAGLKNPMFIVHNHANALPASVTLDGVPLTADTDYFATVDPANGDHADNRLWLTIDRVWSGSHTLAVQ